MMWHGLGPWQYLLLPHPGRRDGGGLFDIGVVLPRGPHDCGPQATAPVASVDDAPMRPLMRHRHRDLHGTFPPQSTLPNPR